MPEGKRLFGKIRRSWEDNTERNLMEMGRI
jgi:hypothetical protein